MYKTFDAIIIGGGIIGAATGYHLARRGLKICILEKDYLTAGSTGRCITGIRQQFSTPASIKTAMDSVKQFSQMQDELGIDIEWTNSGYLFLAYDDAKINTFHKNIEIQKKSGLDVKFIMPDEIKKRVPLVNTDDMLGAAWCDSDGQANPFQVVRAYITGIKNHGGKILIGRNVTKINVNNNKAESVETENGDIYFSSMIVNAAGPWAKEVGQLAGIDLPVEPERHEALITEGVEYLNMPMLVDYRADGGYFVQRLSGQFIGCFTPEQLVLGKNTDSTVEFLSEMSRRMCRLVPALENVAILRQWAGSYCMTPDGSPIVGETDVTGFYCAVGMSGHGFMLAPAIGSYLAQYMTEKSWPFDLSEFAYGRQFGQKESLA